MTPPTVTRTLSEIAATATKAARGAGCPWGLAEDAGMAARLLEAHGLPGVIALVRVFDVPRECVCAGGNGPAACGIAALALLSDRAGGIAAGEDMTFTHVASPILLAGSLLLAARTLDCAFELSWPGARIIAAPEGIAIPSDPGGWPDAARDLRVTRGEVGIKVVSPEARSRHIPAKSWARLQALAERTMVPETETSRARGAGPANEG